MQHNRTLMIVALAALPTLAGAQRVNVRGERAGDIGGCGFQMPRSSDLEDHSPVGIVLDKKKLALSDSQVSALKDIAKALKEKNGAYHRGWDSVRVTMRSAGGGAFGGGGGGRGASEVGGTSAVDREVLATARTNMMGLRRAVGENDEWARLETLKVLTPEQRAKTEEYWKDDAEDFGQTVPGAGGRPGGGGRPGAGGRPGSGPPGDRGRG
ncbi:MAG: hypothetical protein HYV19_01390 [Gemmatimonadetes bacterium]|nr:hypothetical protein [Gemmatimonadota bacterium]